MEKLNGLNKFDNVSDQINITKIPTEVIKGDISGRDAKKINDIQKDKQLLGIFKVKKLAAAGWSSNDRILVLEESKISYYNVPNFKEAKEFIKILDIIAIEQKNYASHEEKLMNFYNLNREKLTSYFKADINFENAQISLEVSDSKNPKGWQTCVEIFEEKSTGERDHPLIYNTILPKKEKDEKSAKKSWILTFIDNHNFDRFKKMVADIKRKREQNNSREIGNTKFAEQIKNPIKTYNKREEDPLKKEEKNKIKEETVVADVEPDVVHLMYYNEIIYQYLLKQYHLNNAIKSNTKLNNPSQLQSLPSTNKLQKMKYEVALYQLNSNFKEICQNFAKKIVNDMTKQIQKNSLYPIVFPVPSSLRKPEQAVFLYYIEGINFTLTWHQTLFEMKSEPKNDSDKILLDGAFYHLNADFKNRDYFNDIMLKLSENHGNATEMPRYPLSCLVDYCGFRILCEADIYIEDGGVEVLKRNDNTAQHSKGDEFQFYKDFGSILSQDRSEKPQSNNNITFVNSKITDTTTHHSSAEFVFPVHFSKFDSRSEYRVKNFEKAYKYHFRQLKEVENTVFSQPEFENIIKDIEKVDSSLEKKEEQLKSVGEETNEEKDEGKLINIKSKEFLQDQSKTSDDYLNKGKIDLKDFNNSVKYIMDLKVITEIRDKDINETSNKKQVNNELQFPQMPKRSIYFRSEYIKVYMREKSENKSSKIQNEKEEVEDKPIFKDLRKILLQNDNGEINENLIWDMTHYLKNTHIFYLVNCLDTLYFRPYDSETLTETMHQYGVNMFFLGAIAEYTEVPHIRELCLIEMISRICKKIIFDITALKYVVKANDNYYKGNADQKNTKENEYLSNSPDSFLNFIPVAFFYKYWKDYLKKFQTLKNNPMTYKEENNSNKQKIMTEGLYRTFWHNYSHYKETDIKQIYQPKDEKNPKGVSKDINELNILQDIKKDVAQFLTVLFDFNNKKTCKILNVDNVTNKQLWELIFDRIKTHYKFDKKEVCSYIDPKYISLPALLSSIQYHAGITVSFTVVSNTSYSNNDLINRDFSEESIEIKSKVKSYSFKNFEINSGKFETVKNDYSLIEIEEDTNITKNVVLRYLAEKYQKTISNYTSSYIHYLHILHKMDLKSSTKEGKFNGLVEKICKTDKNIDFLEFYKRQFTENSKQFESVNFLFLQIIEIFQRGDDSVQNQTLSNNITSKNNLLTDDLEFKSANAYISEFWFDKHPFVALLYILRARIYLWTYKRFDENVKRNFNQALEIAKSSLGINNLFVAFLCEEIGYGYLKEEAYSEGTKLHIMAYNCFKIHKDEFFECYMKTLKSITKYQTIIGYYKEALEYGEELVQNYLENKPKTKDLEDEDFGIENIVYNLILVAKSLKKYDSGIKLCRVLLYKLASGEKLNPQFSISIKPDWRKVIQINKKNDNDNVGETKIELFKIIKVYLKLLIRNLKGNERYVYIQSVVKLIETKFDREYIRNKQQNIMEIFESFKDELKDKEEFSLYFEKLLNVIDNKFKSDQEKGFSRNFEAVQHNENEFLAAWNKFRDLFLIYQNQNVFTAFIDTDVYGYFFKKKKK